jgi:hypothetical protein
MNAIQLPTELFIDGIPVATVWCSFKLEGNFELTECFKESGKFNFTVMKYHKENSDILNSMTRNPDQQETPVDVMCRTYNPHTQLYCDVIIYECWLTYFKTHLDTPDCDEYTFVGKTAQMVYHP